ncbi:unnamed protein product [Prorocentrum cordatum]|uniref:Transmembrane protein 242 n=1 Tax=Prorocentrum cordatum TaxID=2364126 RepID=A0ABN9PYI6_9DINO|nr:unnamed protein product [Polarella glacialis]
MGASASQSRLGPLVCRGEFDGMQIPGVGEEERIPEDGRMGFTAAQVAPAEVAAGERTKNLSLVTGILLSFSCGLALLYSSWISAGSFGAEALTSRVCSLTTPRSGLKWPLGPAPVRLALSALPRPRGMLSGAGTPEEVAMLRGEDSEGDEGAGH